MPSNHCDTMTPRDTLTNSFTTSYSGVATFIAVVVEGSFAKASNRLGIGRSAVSRSVQKLEEKLGIRLFQRTTRCTSMTPEGELFYANCRRGVDYIVLALDDMRDLRDGPPRGRLRVGSSIGFGRKVVAPLLQGFGALYPDLTLEVVLDDAPIDFTTDRVDVAFRCGRQEDSQIIARQLIPMQMIVCASPEYAHAQALPSTIDDLAEHQCINFRSTTGRVHEWEFKVDGKALALVPHARHTFNDADVVLQAVLDSVGIAQLPGYLVCDLLRTGKLVACLAQSSPEDRGHYLCYQTRRHLPQRVRVFIDYVTTRIRELDLDCTTNTEGLTASIHMPNPCLMQPLPTRGSVPIDAVQRFRHGLAIVPV